MKDQEDILWRLMVVIRLSTRLRRITSTCSLAIFLLIAPALMILLTTSRIAGRVGSLHLVHGVA